MKKLFLVFLSTLMIVSLGYAEQCGNSPLTCDALELNSHLYMNVPSQSDVFTVDNPVHGNVLRLNANADNAISILEITQPYSSFGAIGATVGSPEPSKIRNNSHQSAFVGISKGNGPSLMTGVFVAEDYADPAYPGNRFKAAVFGQFFEITGGYNSNVWPAGGRFEFYAKGDNASAHNAAGVTGFIGINGANATVTHATSFYGIKGKVYSGEVTNMYGAIFDKQTDGINNYGIVLNGYGSDGDYGAALVLGDPATSAVRLYSKADGKLYVHDGTNETLHSPHDPVTNEWIYYSKNVRTGKVLRVNMEELVRDMEKLTGKKYLIESFEKDK